MTASERMAEIAAQLGEEYRRRAEIQIDIVELQASIAGWQLKLVPPAGWTGSNQTARDVARDQAYRADPDLVVLTEELSAGEAWIITHNARIAVLEAERRALEWSVRARLAQALGAPDEDAFTAALDGAAVEARQAEVSAGLDAMDEEAVA